MFLVGLTGGIASGKSTVAELISELGIPVIDADLIARAVVEPGKPAWKKIKEAFGNDVILENGEINRAALGDIIFKNSEKRKRLNEITHPEIFKTMIWNCIYYLLTGQQCVVLDVPLLYETRRYLPFVEFVIVVHCKEEQQIARMGTRNDLSPEEAKNRIDAQISLAQKCQLANFVVDNSGPLEETKKQVGCIVQDIRNSRAEWKVRLLLLSGVVCVVSTVVWASMRR